MDTMSLVLRRTGQLGLPGDPWSFTSSTTSSGSGSSTWGRVDNYVNQGVALLSQWLGSRGKYQTSQIVPNSGGGFTSLPVFDPNASQAAAAVAAASLATRTNTGYGNNNAPGSLGAGLDSIVGFLTTPVGLLVVGGVVLLFLKPPGRK